MTERRLVNLNDFVTEKTTYNRFGEKVTKTPLVRIADGGLLSNYKQLSTNAKYIKFTGMLEPNDGGEGMYIQDDTITDDEDLGVIIYIGEHKYRRLYAAWVNIDWFYTDDFGVALQRAIKYSSIRGTRGKTYECKSVITLYIATRHIGVHGMVDLGHKLIDMRNATVNFTNEEEKYCFNIRIYHRDTKFMFTNCNFNVTSNNINLVNIANIIGVNSYTDMLTDNVYNVTKDKLPDTNRVVLVDEPEIEGIKTFENTGQLQYIGDAISANDNQAVTKEYKPADYDESLYVSLQDTRKLDGLTTFTNIFDRDQGNTVLQGKINDYILQFLKNILADIVINTILPIFPYRSYYSSTNNYDINTLLPNMWILHTIIDYCKVYTRYNNNILQLQLQPVCIIDENEVDIPIYIKILCSKPQNIAKTNIEEVIDTSAKQAIANSVVFEGPSSIEMPTVTVTITSQISINGKNGYKGTFIYNNAKIFCIVLDDIAYSYYNITDNIVLYDNNTIGTIITIGNINKTVTVKLQRNIGNLIRSNNLIVKKVKNSPIKVASIIITGKEYLAINQDLDFYIIDYIDNNTYITTSYLYLKCVIPIQANLIKFNTAADTKPCALLSIVFTADNEVISSNQCGFYIVRYKSIGNYWYEVPAPLKFETAKINYPCSFLYTNNYIADLYIVMCYSTNKYFLNGRQNDTIGHEGSYRREAVYDSGGSASCGFCTRGDFGVVKISDYYRYYSNTIAYNVSPTLQLTNATNVDITFHKLPDYESLSSWLNSTNGTAITSYNFTHSDITIYGYGAFTGTPSSKSFAAGSYLAKAFIGFGNGITIANPRGTFPSQHNPHVATSMVPQEVLNGKLDKGYKLSRGTNLIIHNYYYTEGSAPYTTARHGTLLVSCGTQSNACAKDCVTIGCLEVIKSGQIATPLYYSITSNIGKSNCFNRIIGQTWNLALVIRDGILKDPFRHRTQLPEHQFAAPVGVVIP